MCKTTGLFHLLPFLICCICLIFPPAAAGGLSINSNSESIVFLHTNDEHGVIENYGRIAWKAGMLKNKYDHVFIVSAGDIFSGNPLVDEYFIEGQNLRGLPVIILMNMVGYDAMVIGNHDFDYGQEILAERMATADFHFVLANICTKDGYLPQPDPYVVLTTGAGTKVAFLGLIEVTPQGIPSTHPDNLNGLTFFDPIMTAFEFASLREEVDLIVGLTHLGYTKDKELATYLGELDLIIGGHSHSKIKSPDLYNDTLIVQAGSRTEYLGKIIVELSSTGEILNRSGKLLPVKDIDGTDPAIEAMITYFNNRVAENFSRPVITLTKPLTGNMELGGLMADALRCTLAVDFAFQNYGGIRIEELGGTVTTGDIFALEPFGNEIIIFAMTPADIRSLICYSYHRRNTLNLAVSGLHYTVTVNPLNDFLGVDLFYPDGDPLDENRVYQVAFNSYMAAAYEFTARDEGVNTHRRHKDLLVEYLEMVNQEEIDRRRPTNRINLKTVSRIIGYTRVPLSTWGKGSGSVSAGNLIADALATISGADIGIYPTSQLLAGREIPAGPLDEGTLINVLYNSFKYNNNIIVLTATGRDIEKMFHNQNRRYGGPASQVSSRVTYKIYMEDDNVKETTVYIDGEHIDPETVYSVALDSYQYQFYTRDIDTITTKTGADFEARFLLAYISLIEEVGEEVLTARIEIKRH